MSHEEIKRELERAIGEHKSNHAAVLDTTIPLGLQASVMNALNAALTAKLARVFDPQK